MNRYIGCETARELLDAFMDGELSVDEQVKTCFSARVALPADADDNPWARHGAQWQP